MWNDRPAYDCLGQNVGAMVEARNAKEWEDQNKDDFNYFPAKYRAEDAIHLLNQAIDRLFKAADYATGTNYETEFESTGNKVEDIVCDIRAIIRRMEGKSA